MFGRDEKISTIRLTAVQYVILAIFLVLAYGLWRLQVMQSDTYASLAEKNKTRDVPILAPRGKILDREGRSLIRPRRPRHVHHNGKRARVRAFTTRGSHA